MNVLDRWITTFDHEEPDYVSSFVQVIMRKKQLEIDQKYGDEFGEEDLVFTQFGDYTLQKWCGFEASWGASIPYKVSHPGMAPARYLVKDGDGWRYVDELPPGTTHYQVETWDGKVQEVIGDNRDINFYVDGHLYAGPGGIIDQPEYDPKATMELWTERFSSRRAEVLEDEHVYDEVTRNYHETIEKFDFLPIFGLHGFAEAVRESFGIKAFSRFAIRNPEVIEHAVKMHENQALVNAEAAAKTGVKFYVIADDVAFKRGVFCSPRQYKRFFAPLYKKIADIVHKAGAKIFFHSDGYTEPYWPIWIEYCGFDGQESLEPEAWMFPENYEDKPIHDEKKAPNLVKPGKVIRYLKETYGDRFVLIGNMDMSTVMPLATPDEIGWVTRDIIESGAPGGGYVFSPCTDLTEATPLENIVAMREAYRKYRHCY